MHKLLIFVLLSAVVACSNKATYENIQINNRNECAKAPPAQYDECMARANRSYEEYQREREELLEE